MINKFLDFTCKNQTNILLLYFAGPLFIAYIAQYGFDILPCPLCMYQRYGFFAGIGIAVLFKFFDHKFFKVLLLIAITSILAIAIYNFGIEEGYFELSESCQISQSDITSIADLRSQLLNSKNHPTCDMPQFTIFGLSFAALNIIYTFCGVIFFGYIFIRGNK